MERQGRDFAQHGATSPKSAIRFLVQSALRDVMSEKNSVRPGNRAEWVAHLAKALMSESDSPYKAVLSSLIANGVSSEEIHQSYVPEAARHLGELWGEDTASFVDVTVGTGRLQALFRSSDEAMWQSWASPACPQNHSLMMIIPRFEQHSLGAFVAADQLRRLGVWVHMAICVDPVELIALINDGQYCMLGITVAAPENLGRAGELLDFIRANSDRVPPIVIGGRVVMAVEDAAQRSGADHAVRCPSEIMALCDQSSTSGAQALGAS